LSVGRLLAIAGPMSIYALASANIDGIAAREP
jgi:hypothetical protein